MRVKIIDIYLEDGYYEQRGALIGKIGEFKKDKKQENGFYSGNLFFDEYIEEIGGSHAYFYKVKYEVLDEKIK